MGAKQSPRLARARAFYRVAAKSDRKGDFSGAAHYRKLADLLVREDRRERESRARRKTS